MVESSIHQCGSKGFGADWPSQTPKGWSVKRLKHVVTVSPGKAHLTRLPDTTLVTFVPMESVGTDGQIDRADEKELNMVYNGFTYFADGDVVIAKVTPCFENGKAALLSGLKNGIGFGTTELTTLRPSNAVYPKWLFYLVRSQEVGELGKSWMFGVAGLKRIPDDFFRLLPITLPPLTEQQAIATFLDRETAKIDTLIEKQQRLVTLLTEKRQAVISHAVTKGLDTTIPMKDTKMGWLGTIPRHWQLPPLYTRYRIELGKMLDNARISGDHLLPYLRNTDVKWNAINFDELPEMDIAPSERERYTVRPGDVLVCEGGEVGRSAIVSSEIPRLGFQKALHRMRPLNPREVPAFMCYTLQWAANRAVFAVEGNQSTIVHLTAEKLRLYRFPTPNRSEQVAIVSYLDSETAKIDILIDKANQSIDLMKERRSALISAAVTGKIDVRKAMNELPAGDIPL